MTTSSTRSWTRACMRAFETVTAGVSRTPCSGSILRQLDNVTHTIFAATLARTPLARAGRGTTAALIIASNAPDIDIVVTAGGPLKYLEWHRGPTHGPLGVVGLGLMTAGLVWIGRRIQDRRETARDNVPVGSTIGADRDASFGMLVA